MLVLGWGIRGGEVDPFVYVIVVILIVVIELTYSWPLLLSNRYDGRNVTNATQEINPA